MLVSECSQNVKGSNDLSYSHLLARPKVNSYQERNLPLLRLAAHVDLEDSIHAMAGCSEGSSRLIGADV